MRTFFPVLILIILASQSRGQEAGQSRSGNISFISPQNIYVKFKSTQDISIGDTLFIAKGDSLVPSMIVRYLSTTSVACNPIGNLNLAQGMTVWFTQKAEKNIIVKPMPREQAILIPPENKDSVAHIDSKTSEKKQEIRGYLSAASYLFFVNQPNRNSQRMQYTLSLRARNLNNSALSLESYISFRHKIHEWSEISDNIFNGLKIYNLNAQYDFTKKFNVLIGRKLNPKFSNLGVSDGIQFNMFFKPFTIGIIAGSRPDPYDYGFNFKLLQYGGYIFHETSIKNGIIQNTIAFIEQKNSGNTDRRFAYLQHYNTILPNLYFFGSAEIDLYKKTLAVTDSTATPDTTYSVSNKPRLSSLYLSIRYRLSRRINMSVSYSARQNIIYYETYKNFIDRLLQTDTRQGYNGQVSYRPVNKITIGVNVGYNFQQSDAVKSKNLNMYLSWTQVPIIKSSATLSSIILETSYVKGKIYRLDISRDIIPGKLYGSLDYSYVNYLYSNSEYNLPQNVGEINLSWKILPKLTFSVFGESTFEKSNRYNRIYILLNNRF